MIIIFFFPFCSDDVFSEEVSWCVGQNVWSFFALQGARPRPPSPLCWGKSCTFDDRCEECHDCPDERCRTIANYIEKLSLQCERKKERKTKLSSSSFSGFSPSMLVPLGQLPSLAGSRVVATSASSFAVCATTYELVGPAVTTAPIVSCDGP